MTNGITSVNTLLQILSQKSLRAQFLRTFGGIPSGPALLLRFRVHFIFLNTSMVNGPSSTSTPGRIVEIYSSSSIRIYLKNVLVFTKLKYSFHNHNCVFGGAGRDHKVLK